MSKNEDKNSIEPKSISYGRLGSMASFFMLGILCLLIYQNAASEKITLGTTEIMNFVFSVALSTASIILAVSAISLGKASEKAMIERSDESIKLQNEVFRLTNEALNRIQSSTGVTEKRIEDIISGRVGDISSKIAGVLDESGVTIKNRKFIEKEIRESLMKEVAVTEDTDAEKAAQQEERRKRNEARKEYENYMNRIIISLSNNKELTALKIGHGEFRGEGTELFDCIYKLEDKLIGISIFDSDVPFKEPTINTINGSDYLKKLIIEAKKDNYSNIILISKENEYSELLQENIQMYNHDIAKKIAYIHGPSETVTQLLFDKIKT